MNTCRRPTEFARYMNRRRGLVFVNPFSQNHKIAWVEKELKDHLVSTTLPWAGSQTTVITAKLPILLLKQTESSETTDYSVQKNEIQLITCMTRNFSCPFCPVSSDKLWFVQQSKNDLLINNYSGHRLQQSQQLPVLEFLKLILEA